VSDPGKKRILLVDDNEFSLFCYGEYLAARDFHVDTAHTIDDALRKMARFDPHLVILEIGMAGTGGLTLLKRMRGPDNRLLWPVLVHTVRPELRDFCTAIGVDGFLIKTGYGDELLQEIRTIFAERAARVKDESAPPPVRKVLLAEDDPAVADNIRKAFQRGGYEVVLIVAGPAVFDAVQAVRPAAIVLKNILAGMNGSAVAEALSRQPAARGIPVVLYDATLPRATIRVQHHRTPPGVRLFLGTAEATLLVEAVSEVLEP
jgi:DNA-binding response OmpR family regulator